MSTRVVYQGEEVARRVQSLGCVRCGAKPQQRCTTKSGRRATHWHALRWYAAVREGLVPVYYVDGEPT